MPAKGPEPRIRPKRTRRPIPDSKFEVLATAIEDR
jgi:hypothetical protein